MPLDRPTAQRSLPLGAFWQNQLPAAQFRILPSWRAWLVRFLFGMTITIAGICGLVAGLFAFGLN
jgi:hypothetical protein